jgi:hypothetical protein
MSIDHFDMIIAHQITSRRRGYLHFTGLTIVALIVLIGIFTM